MFTGIIEALGSVRSLEQDGARHRMAIDAPFAPELRVDQSVAVNGVCLTVVGQSDGAFSVDMVPETLAKTSLGDLQVGAEVNLERALRPDGRLDGHLVLGHVDVAGEVVGISDDSEGHLVSVRYPAGFAANLVSAGCVTLDGIAFTVARLADAERELTVAVIPHTRDHTTVRDWAPGRRVNLEFDVLGKYVLRAMARGGGEDLPRRFLSG